MGFFDNIDVERLRIEKFIFHVVHHGENQPILLNETPIGQFEDFFLDRVRETVKGNKFNFIEGSRTFEILKNLEDEKETFLKASHSLAIDFHTRQNKTIKPGVMLFIVLTDGQENLYSIIKYDHEQVLAYELSGNNTAILQEVKNSFTKTKEALHKSALIRLNDCCGEVIVIDQKIAHGITEFFKGFLNIKRKYQNTQMTEVVQLATQETVKEHRKELPQEFKQNFACKLVDTIKRTKVFDAESFFDKTFGPYGTEGIKKTFLKKLRKKDLADEVFEFDSSTLTPPKTRKLKTKEGVEVKYPNIASDTVKIVHGAPGEKTKITITTDGVDEI